MFTATDDSPFALTAEFSASLSARIPTGWGSQTYTTPSGRHKRAIDPDGCLWYWEGAWILNVTGFNSSRRGLETDDIAMVETTDGKRPYPISKAGIISIGSRRIPSSKWNH
jgi:hypothetical protein